MTALPKTWQLATLNDLQSSAPRSITDGPFGSNLTSAHYTNTGPRVVRLQNIGNGIFRDQKAHISPEHFSRLKSHEVKSGDLLIASLGDLLPRACLAPANLGPAIVKADCIRVRLGNQVDPRWAMYAMQTPEIRRWAQDQLHGIGRLRLGLKVIRNIPIPLPPIDQQRTILGVLEDQLSRLDAAIKLTSAVDAQLGALWKAALSHWVFQRGTRRTTIREVVSRIEAGRSFGASAAPAAEDEWGIIKVSAMTWGQFRPQENKAVPASFANRRFEISEGDLLVSRANTSAYVGASVLVGETRAKLLLSDKSLRLVPHGHVNKQWLWLALSSPEVRTQISGMATGTKDSMRNISQSNLLDIAIPLVSSADQTAAVSALTTQKESIDQLSTATERSHRRGSALRGTLLTAAFTGQLGGKNNGRKHPGELIGV